MVTHNLVIPDSLSTEKGNKKSVFIRAGLLTWKSSIEKCVEMIEKLNKQEKLSSLI